MSNPEGSYYAGINLPGARGASGGRYRMDFSDDPNLLVDVRNRKGLGPSGA